MRFDIVMLVMILILVAFGFTISDWMQMRDRLQQALDQVRQLQEQLSQLQQEYQMLNDQNATLQGQVQSLTQANSRLSADKGSLQQNLKDLQATNLELKRNLDAMKQENDGLKTQAASPGGQSACLAADNLSQISAAAEVGTSTGKAAAWLLTSILALGSAVWGVLIKVGRHKKSKMYKAIPGDYVRLNEQERMLIVHIRRKRGARS